MAAATAAAFVDGRRVGSAVLVAARYLVTAAHVVMRTDPETGVRVPVGQVEVEFPALGGEEQAGRVPSGRGRGWGGCGGAGPG